MNYQLIVVGGGPAGLAAAYEAYNNGIKNILITSSLFNIKSFNLASGIEIFIFTILLLK